MTTTVSTNVNPATEAPTANRTLTYPLLGGGIITATCPDWCTNSHENDLRATGIDPSDIHHTSDEATLDFTLYGGERVGVLAAVIAQDPFSGREISKPRIVFCPISGDEPVQEEYLTAHAFGEVIDQLQAHVDKLRRLQERLAQACADEHTRYYAWLDKAGNTAAKGTWQGLRVDDVKSMPLPYLLGVFGAVVIEDAPEDFTPTEAAYLNGYPGDLKIRLDRSLPQAAREAVVRDLLVQVVEAQR